MRRVRTASGTTVRRTVWNGCTNAEPNETEKPRILTASRSCRATSTNSGTNRQNTSSGRNTTRGIRSAFKVPVNFWTERLRTSASITFIEGSIRRNGVWKFPSTLSFICAKRAAIFVPASIAPISE